MAFCGGNCHPYLTNLVLGKENTNKNFERNSKPNDYRVYMALYNDFPIGFANTKDLYATNERHENPLLFPFTVAYDQSPNAIDMKINKFIGEEGQYRGDQAKDLYTSVEKSLFLDYLCAARLYIHNKRFHIARKCPSRKNDIYILDKILFSKNEESIENVTDIVAEKNSVKIFNIPRLGSLLLLYAIIDMQLIKMKQQKQYESICLYVVQDVKLTNKKKDKSDIIHNLFAKNNAAVTSLYEKYEIMRTFPTSAIVQSNKEKQYGFIPNYRPSYLDGINDNKKLESIDLDMLNNPKAITTMRSILSGTTNEDDNINVEDLAYDFMIGKYPSHAELMGYVGAVIFAIKDWMPIDITTTTTTT